MLVSVFMPTRNRAALLAAGAASVLSQTYRDIELLIVDDGSTDETPSVLADLATRDDRVRHFRNDVPHGAPHARNIAIAAATGHWITGIDDDDSFHPERVAALVEYWRVLEQAGQAFSCRFTQDIYDNGTSRTFSRKSGSPTWSDLFEYNVVGNQAFTLTERLRGVGMFDPDMPAWQDLDLFIRLLKQYGPARLLDLPLYTVNLDERPDRISRQKKDRIVAAFERLSGKHADARPKQIQSLLLQVFGDLYGFKPDARDVSRFMRYGWDGANMRRLLRAWLR
jgi:glycosyltransferase involved in cell wall biosynthesis